MAVSARTATPDGSLRRGVRVPYTTSSDSAFLPLSADQSQRPFRIAPDFYHSGDAQPVRPAIRDVGKAGDSLDFGPGAANAGQPDSPEERQIDGPGIAGGTGLSLYSTPALVETG